MNYINKPYIIFNQMSTGGHLSKDLYELIKLIGDTKSKQQEDKIILKEQINLKEKLKRQKNMSAKKMKQQLIKAIYIEMLGHDASFCYIHAINLTQDKNLCLKRYIVIIRLGYLTSTLFLNQQSQLLILMTSTIQRDLASNNIHQLVICLTALPKLMNSMVATAIEGSITKLLNHQTDLIRKKALLVVQKMNTLSPGSISGYQQKLRRALCDRQPSIMAVAVSLYLELTRSNLRSIKQLASSFVIILKQIIQHKLKEYDYHQAPAPWIQINIMKVLGILGKTDLNTSEHIYQILRLTLSKATEYKGNIKSALIFQAIKTIATIYPNKMLLEQAAKQVGFFLSSDSNNQKFMGICALKVLVKNYPKALDQLQLVIIDCLQSKDETLKKQTMQLLCIMTNQNNIQIISTKMLHALKTTNDPFVRETIIIKLALLCEQFSPSLNFFLNTFKSVFIEACEYIPSKITNSFLNVINQKYEQQKQYEPILNFALQLSKECMGDQIIKVVSYIIGQFGHQLKDQQQAMDQLGQVLIQMNQFCIDNQLTKMWLIIAIAKISVYKCSKNNELKKIMQDFNRSKQVNIYQCSLGNFGLQEHRKLAKYNQALRESKDPQVDQNLKFLDGYINHALKNGAKRYKKSKQVIGKQIKKQADLNFVPYPEMAKGMGKSTVTIRNQQTYYILISQLKRTGKQLWSQTGYLEQKKTQIPKVVYNNMGGVNMGNNVNSIENKKNDWQYEPQNKLQERQSQKQKEKDKANQNLAKSLFNFVPKGPAKIVKKPIELKPKQKDQTKQKKVIKPMKQLKPLKKKQKKEQLQQVNLLE